MNPESNPLNPEEHPIFLDYFLPNLAAKVIDMKYGNGIYDMHHELSLRKTAESMGKLSESTNVRAMTDEELGELAEYYRPLIPEIAELDEEICNAKSIAHGVEIARRVGITLTDAEIHEVKLDAITTMALEVRGSSGTQAKN